jgi:hypothetical protein
MPGRDLLRRFDLVGGRHPLGGLRPPAGPDPGLRHRLVRRPQGPRTGAGRHGAGFAEVAIALDGGCGRGGAPLPPLLADRGRCLRDSGVHQSRLGALGLDRVRRRGWHRRLPGVPEDHGNGCRHGHRWRRQALPRPGDRRHPEWRTARHPAPAASRRPARPRSRHPLRGPQRVVRREQLAGRLHERAAGSPALCGRQPLVGRDHLAGRSRAGTSGRRAPRWCGWCGPSRSRPPRGNHPPDGRPGAAAPPLASAG